MVPPDDTVAKGALGAGHPAEDAPIEVMVLGTVHLANPGRDLHNTKVGDVFEPEFQAEIARVTDALARFAPTAVQVEMAADDARQDYALYLAGRLTPSRSESVQIGFRLARQMGLATVHGIDVDMALPYDDVQAFAEAHGQQALLDSLHAKVGALARAEEELLERRGLAALLRLINDPESIREGHGFYRIMTRIGAGDEQPGAEMLAAWTRRNLLIGARMLQLCRPSDRVLAIFGAGHAYLLRQCVSETPGMRLVEANDHLPA